MSDLSKPSTRPLSPHLQVYRLPMTALMSITHRITGAILTGGMLLITAFLAASAMGEDYFLTVQGYAQGWFGMIFLLLWAFVLYYHLCNGVRHLIWDTASMLDEKQAVISGWIVIIATIVLTAATWCCATNY